MHKPDEGEILIEGKQARIDSPMDALAAGIETIYQDFALAENLDVGANIFLGPRAHEAEPGHPQGPRRPVDEGRGAEGPRQARHKHPSLKKTIRTLSGGQRQAVAISRSIYWDAKVLIMDEPTAALGVAEQKKVLNLVRTLKDQGIGIIIISHQMYDVFEVADRLAVMRRGLLVGERMVKDTTADEVVGLIVGSERVGKEKSRDATAAMRYIRASV